MSDEQNNGNQNSDGDSAGEDIPLFKAGSGKPSVFSASDMNRLVSRLNALADTRVNIQQTPAQNDGSTAPYGTFTLSDQNAILDLFLNLNGSSGGGGSSVQLMQVQSFTAGNAYVSCKLATATASNTYTVSGSALNVALPFKLRTNTYNSPGFDLPYAANDVIIATQPTGGTGVFVSGTDVGWVDINYDGREWQNVDYFNLVSMFANYFTATSIASGLTVAIAKPPELRNSITSETIDGNSWAYTYGASSPYQYVARLATATISTVTYNEYQVIVPRYLSTSIIKARRMPTGLTDGSSNPINWQEESGREWAASVNQSGYE